MSAPWTTLKEIKAAEVSKIASGLNALKKELHDYARVHHGSFLIFGSAANGTFRFDSDVDVLIDFPAETLTAAWRFCEDACRQHGLVPDVRPKSLCSPAFVKKVSASALEISGA
jgi:predicted nucleotidyltransferase